MREVIRVQLLALHPLKVFGIIAGLALTLGWIAIVALLDSGLPALPMEVVLRQFSQLQYLMYAGRIDLLALIVVGLCVIWAVLGGAVTRLMARDIAGLPRESIWQALVFCCVPALLLPSALATSCLILLIIAPAQPWALVAVLPVWLYAGFLYGPLVERHVGVGAALTDAHQRLSQGRRLVRLQLTYLVGFVCSTGVVYVIALLWILLVTTWVSGALEWVLTLPIALYALGYTTANLKSLQLHLYRQLGVTDDHR